MTWNKGYPYSDGIREPGPVDEWREATALTGKPATEQTDAELRCGGVAANRSSAHTLFEA
jgi:hypothetical protein